MRISDWSSDVCSSDLDIADLGERGRVPVVGVERRGRVGNHVLIGGRLSYVLRERGAFLLGTLHRKALVAGALESLNLRLVVRTEPTTDTAIGVIERGQKFLIGRRPVKFREIALATCPVGGFLDSHR